MEPSDVEAVAEHVVWAAKEAITETHGRVGIAPVAVILADDKILTAPILDITQRRESIRSVVREHGGDGFVLVYGGRLSLPGIEADAVFCIWLMRDGTGKATAYTWQVVPGRGVVFDAEISQDHVAQQYAVVFRLPEQKSSVEGLKSP